MQNRLAAAAFAMLVSIAVFLALLLSLTGPTDIFRDLLDASVWQNVGLSMVAAIIRLSFRRGGLILSAACGGTVAIAGFLILLAAAYSRI